MARIDCYSKPIHISVPTTSYHLCSEYYLSESEPADFDKEAVDLKIQELADLLFDCDDIYSNCETVDSEIIDFFSMDDNPLDIFDIDFQADIDFNLYLVKQKYSGMSATDTNYHAMVDIKDSPSSGEKKPRITLRTNILDDIYNHSNKIKK